MLKLSSEVKECKPLGLGRTGLGQASVGSQKRYVDKYLARMVTDGKKAGLHTRGLHSSTVRLNLSAFCRIGVHSRIVEWVFRRCQGVFRSIRGCSGCILCHKRFRLR